MVPLLGTGSDPKLQEQIRTPSFNELKSLRALFEDKRLFSTPTWICEETCQSAGHETLSLSLSLSEQGRRTLSSLLSHAKAPNSIEA